MWSLPISVMVVNHDPGDTDEPVYGLDHERSIYSAAILRLV